MRNLIFLILILLISCSGGQFKNTETGDISYEAMEEEDASAYMPKQPVADYDEKDNAEIKNETKLIKEANLSIEVEDVNKSLILIKDYVQRSKGYI